MKLGGAHGPAARSLCLLFSTRELQLRGNDPAASSRIFGNTNERWVSLGRQVRFRVIRTERKGIGDWKKFKKMR